VATITLISHVGAIIGGVLIGYWSDLAGRRRAMAFAASGRQQAHPVAAAEIQFNSIQAP
jgi:MFS family permease